MVEQDVARLGLHISNAVAGQVAHLDQVRISLLGQTLNGCFVFPREAAVVLQVDLGQHNDQWLRLEQRLDRVEQGDLLIDGVSAGF